MNIMGTKETSGIEGSWDDWSTTLSAQLLSKQSPVLAKKQLDLVYDRQKKEYDEIKKVEDEKMKQLIDREYFKKASNPIIRGIQEFLSVMDQLKIGDAKSGGGS
jgi:hypothetical protein